MSRRSLLAQIHIAKKELAMDDDVYRLVLKNATGKTSAADLDVSGLHVAIQAMKNKGWKPKQNRKKYSPKTKNKNPDDKTVVDKIRAVWIDAYKNRLIKDGSERALNAYCLRMTGKSNVVWLNGYEAIRLLEALKKWIYRLENE